VHEDLLLAADFGSGVRLGDLEVTGLVGSVMFVMPVVAVTVVAVTVVAMTVVAMTVVTVVVVASRG
jgi:hypothetical protein